MGLKPVFIPEMYREIAPLKDLKAYHKPGKSLLILNRYQHTHAAKAGILGRFAAASCHIPVIVHTFMDMYFIPIFPLEDRSVYRMGAMLPQKYAHHHGQQSPEDLAIPKICPMEKIEVVPLGFDLGKFSEALREKRRKFRSFYQVEEDEIVIVIVGRLVPIKNHELFLKGLRSVLNHTTKKIRAFIVGDGEEHKRLESLAGSLYIDFTNYPEEQGS
jgi:glycosyltransferase involved in cell wall biosynthesis